MASNEDQTIFSPDSVPENFVLGDPDHLNSFKISVLYNHWLTRQRKGLPPFVVLNAGPLHHPLEKKSQTTVKGKGKEKKRYFESGDEEEEKEDEDDKANDEVDGEDDVNPEYDAVMEDEGGDASERESGMPGPSSRKIGPPVGKKRIDVPSGRDPRSPPVPGPSKLPPPKRPQKKAKVADCPEPEKIKPEGRSARKNHVKKSARIEQVSEIPQKVGDKRKRVNEEAPTADDSGRGKRTKLRSQM